MAREIKEVAHLKADLKKYGDNYDHIFKKKEVCCRCEGAGHVADDEIEFDQYSPCWMCDGTGKAL